MLVVDRGTNVWIRKQTEKGNGLWTHHVVKKDCHFDEPWMEDQGFLYFSKDGWDMRVSERHVHGW